MYVQGEEMPQARKVRINNVEDDVQEPILDEDSALSLGEPNPVFAEDYDETDESQQIEDLDDDEPLWENGPLAGTVKEWKDLYGDVYITSISFDKHIVWRTLSRVEYKQIVKRMENLIQSGEMSSAEANMWNEETISELCILFPEMNSKSMSSVLAGLPSLIAQEVLEASGFIALEVRQL
jgi:hypothetical protein